MRFFLDHVIVAVRDVDRATRDWVSLGLVATDGGIHPHLGTRNAIVRFPDLSFLELMAIEDREKLRSNAPVLLGLLERHADRPFSWALRTDDIEAARDRLLHASVPVLDIWPGEARRASGKLARWRSLHTREPGFPFLVQYDDVPTSEPSTDGLPVTGVGALVLRAEPSFLTRLAEAFGATVRDGRLRFHGGAVALEGPASDEPGIVAVELLAPGSDDAGRSIGPDGLAHGLAMRLVAAH